MSKKLPQGYRNLSNEKKYDARISKRKKINKNGGEKKADIKACRSSVPAKGVLSRNGSGDVGSASRARSAVVAVANSGSAIAGHVAAHQSTAHEGRASVAGILHARRTLAAIKGAAAAVSLLLALVTTSNDEHGTTIQSTQADSTDGNTGGGGLLLRGLAIGAAGAKGVVVA